MIEVKDILIKVVPLYEAGGFRNLRKDITELKADTDTASKSAAELGRELTKLDRKDLALHYDSKAADAVLADLDDIDRRLSKVANKKFGVDPSVRAQAVALRGLVADRKAQLEGTTALFKRLQAEELAAATDTSARKVKIAQTEARILQNQNSTGLKSYLSRLRNEEAAAKQSAENRARQVSANAPDLFSGFKGAGRDVSMVGRSLDEAAHAADNWGARLQGLSTVLTRISPILRGVTILIGVTLVSAITAVAASMGAALGAIGAMAASFVAVLGPAVAVVVGFFSRLATVTQALTLRQNVMKAANRVASDSTKASAAHTAKLTSARGTLRDATQGVTAAERGLADAQRNASDAITAAAQQQQDAAVALQQANSDLATATVDAYKAIKQAAEDARDAVLDLEQAKLDEEGAKLDLGDAKQALKDFRAEVGLTGDSFDSMFKKFSDVDVDLSGLGTALADAGGSVSGDDKQKLLRLLHNEREARLNVKKSIDATGDATQTLGEKQKEAARLQKGGIGAVDGYRSAVQRQRKATQDLATATKESNRLQKLGVEGAPAVISAHEAVRDAKEREADASKNLKKVRGEEAGGLTALNHAMDDYQLALSKLSKPERDFIAGVSNMLPAFRDLIRSGTDPIFKALSDIIPKLGVFGPLLTTAFSGIGKSIGTGLSNLFKLLSDPIVLSALQQIAGAAVRMMDVLNKKVVGKALVIFLNVATAALPLLEKALNGAAGVLSKFADSSSGISKDKGVFGLMVDSLNAFWDLLKNVAIDFGLFIRDAAGPGNEIVKFLAAGAKHLGDWLKSKEGRKSLQKFFHDTLPFAKAAVKFVGKLTKVLLQLFQFVAPMAADFLNGLNAILDVFSFALGLLNKLPVWFRRILGVVIPVASALKGLWGAGTVGILGFRIAVGLLVSVINGIGVAVDVAGDKIKGWIKRVLKFFSDFIDSVRRVFKASSPSKVFIEIGLDVMRGFVAGIKAGVKWIASAAGTLARKFISGVRSAFSTIASVATSVFNHLRDGFAVIWGKFSGLGGTLIHKVVAGAKALKDLVEGIALWVYHRIHDGIVAVATKFLDLGKSILGSIAAGIKDKAGLNKLLDAMTGVINAVINTVKRLLDIHSPSGVFRKIGLATVAGYIEGIKGVNLAKFMEGHFGKDIWESAAKALKGGGGLLNLIPVPRAIKEFFDSNRFKLLPWGLSSIPHFGKNRLIKEEGAPLAGSLTSGLLKLGEGALGEMRLKIRNRLLKELGVEGLARGGMVTGDTLARIGEGVNKEVVLPLSKSVMSDLARAITVQMSPMGQAALAGSPSALGAHRHGQTFNQEIHISSPAGSYPDARHTAAAMAAEMRRRGVSQP